MSASAGPQTLLSRARHGSVGARGQLLDLYRSYLMLISRLQISRRLQGKVDASDVVQETFLEANRDFGQFRGAGEAELLSWLRQILARNLANLVRRYQGTKGRDLRLERELTDDLVQSSRALGRNPGQSSPSQRAIRRERAVLLADAIGQLPEHYREVVILRHLEGLRFADVASRMGRTVDSVEKLWVRALAMLRELLQGVV